MSKSTVLSADKSVATKSGIFSRMFAALIKARQLQADREVEIYMSRQSDRTLRDIGMTDGDIHDLRQKYGR
jgi:hypothetical protein